PRGERVWRFANAERGWWLGAAITPAAWPGGGSPLGTFFWRGGAGFFRIMVTLRPTCPPLPAAIAASASCGNSLATSRVQIFADEQARNSFKAQWLDRYLNHYIDSFFIARAEDGVLIGYLAGCLENPMLNPPFNDLGYYK